MEPEQRGNTHLVQPLRAVAEKRAWRVGANPPVFAASALVSLTLVDVIAAHAILLQCIPLLARVAPVQALPAAPLLLNTRSITRTALRPPRPVDTKLANAALALPLGALVNVHAL